MTQVLGYFSRCHKCDLRALTSEPVKRWTCPQCVDDVAVETGLDMGGRTCAEAAAVFPQHTRFPGGGRGAPNGGSGPIAQCGHPLIKAGRCSSCGHIAEYPWGDSIPWPPQADDDDYPIGGVTA